LRAAAEPPVIETGGRVPPNGRSSLSEGATMKPVDLGNMSIQRVEELIWEISPRFLFPDLTREDFEPHRHWLVPHFST